MNLVKKVSQNTVWKRNFWKKYFCEFENFERNYFRNNKRQNQNDLIIFTISPPENPEFTHFNDSCEGNSKISIENLRLCKGPLG